MKRICSATSISYCWIIFFNASKPSNEKSLERSTLHLGIVGATYKPRNARESLTFAWSDIIWHVKCFMVSFLKGNWSPLFTYRSRDLISFASGAYCFAHMPRTLSIWTRQVLTYPSTLLTMVLLRVGGPEATFGLHEECPEVVLRYLPASAHLFSGAWKHCNYTSWCHRRQRYLGQRCPKQFRYQWPWFKTMLK